MVFLAFQQSKCVDKIYGMAPAGPRMSAKSLFSGHLYDSCFDARMLEWRVCALLGPT